MGVDRVGFNFLHGLTDNLGGVINIIIILIAEEFVLALIILGYILAVIVNNSWRFRIYYTSLGVLSIIISRGILTPIIRFFFHRERPFVQLDIEPLVGHAATGAFPSGHMAFAVPLVLTYWMLTKSRKLGILAILGVAFMGIGRVMVGVHWPTDIIGGIFVGTAGFIMARILLDKHFPTVKKTMEIKPKKEKKIKKEINILN